MSIDKNDAAFESLLKMDKEIADLLQRIRTGQTRPEDADLLHEKFHQDTMVPSMRNKAAYQDHLENYGNSGIHVHADMNDFGQVNKLHGEPEGDKAITQFGQLAQPIAQKFGGRSFHNGGDEFKFWFLQPDHAHLFARELQSKMDEWSASNRFGGTHRMAASLGIGFNRDHAEQALQVAKSRLGPKDMHGHRQNKHAQGEAPTEIHSLVTEEPPKSWKPAEQAINDTRKTAHTFHMPGSTALSTTPTGSVSYVHTEKPSTAPPHSFTYNNPLAKQEDKPTQPAQPGHPAVSGGHIGIMTAEFPYEKSGKTNEDLQAELTSRGFKYEPAPGKYEGQNENSFIIHGPSLEDMEDLGKRYGQKSVIHSVGGQHKLIYTHGPRAGTFNPGAGANLFPEQPEDFFTTVNHNGQPVHFNYNFDFDTHVPMRFTRSGYKHPHAYPWHESHTRHHLVTKIQKSEDELEKAEYKNDQAAGAGVKTYAQFAAQYGSVAPGSSSNLMHYDFRPFEGELDKLIAKNGYKVSFFGGKYGKPDLGSKNFNTGHILIHDPTAGSGGDSGEEDYTRTWRKAHELAHALTYGELNAKYGEGRRIGPLGSHRTAHEAKRAVEWEWLAVHRQREIAAQLGHHISDDSFHKEVNTVMHDAVHRAVTGKFSEPAGEGFQPSNKKIPLETALATVDSHSKQMGLLDDHALVQKPGKSSALNTVSA